jgi:hypothetical protein
MDTRALPLLPPPPQGFLPARNVQWAHFVRDNQPFMRPQHKPTGKRLQGVKYETAAQAHIGSIAGGAYLASPWLKFSGNQGDKWCQPDGLLFDLERGIITIVEIKLQHTTDAWWQLRKLYQPVLESMFPPQLWEFRVLEVVKWFDPLVRWPEDIVRIERISAQMKIPQYSTGLHIWKP